MNLVIFDKNSELNFSLNGLTNIIVELIVAHLGSSFIIAGFPNAPSLENIKSPF